MIAASPLATQTPLLEDAAKIATALSIVSGLEYGIDFLGAIRERRSASPDHL
jgi:hypothetical protein